MSNCKFLRQKKQVLVNGEWVDTRSYRYIPYCDGGTPCVIVKNSEPNGRIPYYINDYYGASGYLTLDENGNGYLELESGDIFDGVGLPTRNGKPVYPSSEVEIKGCNVTTGNLSEGYKKIIFSCSIFVRYLLVTAHFLKILTRAKALKHEKFFNGNFADSKYSLQYASKKFIFNY